MVGFIEVDGVKIDVVRKSGKRTLSLKIDRKTGRACVSVPWLCPLIIVKKFVAGHIVWLKKNIEMTPEKQTFHEGMTLCLLGRDLTIQSTALKKGTFIEKGILYVSGKSEFCHRRVKDFIKKEFCNYAKQKAEQYAAQTGKTITHITVRDTASRWGSCSSRSGLSFCWRLALAPAFVCDYVIAHEVAHLSQMNHSAAFWAKVKEINTDTYAAKKWLKENSAYLHSFL